MGATRTKVNYLLVTLKAEIAKAGERAESVRTEQWNEEAWEWFAGARGVTSWLGPSNHPSTSSLFPGRSNDLRITRRELARGNEIYLSGLWKACTVFPLAKSPFDTPTNLLLLLRSAYSSLESNSAYSGIPNAGTSVIKRVGRQNKHGKGEGIPASSFRTLCLTCAPTPRLFEQRPYILLLNLLPSPRFAQIYRRRRPGTIGYSFFLTNLQFTALACNYINVQNIYFDDYSRVWCAQERRLKLALVLCLTMISYQAQLTSGTWREINFASYCSCTDLLAISFSSSGYRYLLRAGI